MKIVALILREKSRDLFDFGSLLQNKVLSNHEIITLFSQVNSQINSVEEIVNFIRLKKEPKDDEAVYISEHNRIDLTFEEIKNTVIKYLLQDSYKD